MAMYGNFIIHRRIVYYFTFYVQLNLDDKVVFTMMG